MASPEHGTNLAQKMLRTWPVAMLETHVACRAGEASQQFHTQMRQSSDPETSLVPAAFQEMVFTHLHTDSRVSWGQWVHDEHAKGGGVILG